MRPILLTKVNTNTIHGALVSKASLRRGVETLRDEIGDGLSENTSDDELQLIVSRILSAVGR